MADRKESNSKSSSKAESLDLNSLSDMSLGPDWGSGNQPKDSLPRERKERRGPQKGGPRRRDPRKGPQGNRPARKQSRPPQPFQPLLEADFYPEEEPFKVLANAVKSSYRTFELFEIAHLILEKPERWVCVAKDPKQKEGEEATLFASVPDGLPFFSEKDALNHVYRHYLGEFFNLETVEVEPPSGAFQMVHRCGFTKKLLGPPNYHRYQALCQQHHAAHLSHLPFEKFQERLESVKEEEVIQEWLESMKTTTKYISKSEPETSFQNIEDARLYLVTKHKEELIRPAFSARFSGKHLALLDSKDPIRRSIETLHQGQMKFPLDTANHLRGRLRKMGFAVYKKGSKGVSYVCAVKRRFRKPGEVLADNLQGLVDFIEAHPNFSAKNLPKDYLGIQKEIESAPKKEEKSASEISKDADESSDPPSEGALEESTKKLSEEKAAELSETDLLALKELKRDLKYLVSEGYVIEYSDGRLFVPAIREEEINRLAKEQETAEVDKKAEEKPTPEVKEAEPVAKKAEATPEKKAEKVESKSEPKAEEARPDEEADSTKEAEPKAEVTSTVEKTDEAPAVEEPPAKEAPKTDEAPEAKETEAAEKKTKETAKDSDT